MRERQNLSSVYFEALGLADTARDAGNPAKKENALARAHQLRAFEIDNYWKRATYFWSFQAIAFALLGFVLNDGKTLDQIEIIQIPAALGAISAWVGFLSARGSKFWQENWESHVDMLEPSSEGRLTQVIWSNGVRSHSVSRLNQAFMALLTLGWIFTMIYASFSWARACIGSLPTYSGLVALFVALAVVSFGTLQKKTGLVRVGANWKPIGRTAPEMPSDTWEILLRDSNMGQAVAPSSSNDET